MTQLPLFAEPQGDDLAPPQGSGAEEATIVDSDRVFDPADPKSARLTVVEELTNPDPPPGNPIPRVSSAIRVTQIFPDPRTITQDRSYHHHGLPP